MNKLVNYYKIITYYLIIILWRLHKTMKKLLTLIIILFATNLFASINPTIKSSDETLYILSGNIDNQHLITMYLTIDNDTNMISGSYYYNKHRKIIYLQAGELDNKSEVILREYFDDEKGNSISSGEFRGAIKYDKDEGVIFKGIWYNAKKSLDFILRLDKNSTINEIKITNYKYKYISAFTSVENTPEFISDFSILEISNPKKLSGIKKINAQLKNFFNINNLYYSNWKNEIEEYATEYPDSFIIVFHSWDSNSLYFVKYIDNTILSLLNNHSSNSGGNHGNTNLITSIYNIDSGELINKSVDDLIIDINNLELLAMLQKKLIDHANTMMDGTETVAGIKDKGYDGKKDYYNFDEIRLNSNFYVDAYGVTFVYSPPYDIAPYSFGSVEITFSYNELKPFVKKSSKLYYLFK